MKIILIGPPGSGKGTQAKKMTTFLSVPHISTGDIFRENIKNETDLGKQAKELIEQGELVSDEITIKMVKDRLAKTDCASGFILDGFPRTIPQAEELDSFQDVDLVIDVEVPDQEIIERITGRRTGEDGKIYHITNNPPPEGAKVTQRKDDTKEVVKNRLSVYHDQTEPIIEHYKKKSKVREIDGTTGIDSVWETIKSLVSK